MNTQIFAALALLSVGHAALLDDIKAVATGASTLSEQVIGFEGSQGLMGALGIQITYYPSFSAQVFSLKSALEGASEDDITPEAVTEVVTLENNVANLLDALASKAGDFDSVGALSIAANDVQELYQPSLDIASILISLASGNCDYVSTLVPGLNLMDASFSRAASSYSLSATPFPTAPACEEAAETSPAPESSPASESPSTTESSSTSESSPAPESSPASESPSTTESSSTSESSPAPESSPASESPSTTESSSTSESSPAPETTATASGSTKRCLVRPTGSEPPATSFIIA